MRKGIKRVLNWGVSALFVAVVLIPSVASSQQSFEDFKKQQQQDFDKFAEEEEAAFEKYKADVEQKWQEFLDSTREKWVSYSEGKETKRVVNFENGYVEIETLIDAKEPGNRRAKGTHLRRGIGM